MREMIFGSTDFIASSMFRIATGPIRFSTSPRYGDAYSVFWYSVIRFSKTGPS